MKSALAFPSHLPIPVSIRGPELWSGVGPHSPFFRDSQILQADKDPERKGHLVMFGLIVAQAVLVVTGVAGVCAAARGHPGIGRV